MTAMCEWTSAARDDRLPQARSPVGTGFPRLPDSLKGMAMRLKVGQTLRSRTDQTAVIVVRAAAEEVEVTCGGWPMVGTPDAAADRQPPADRATEGTQLGKRYVDASGAIELLCIKPGSGTLAVNDAPLTVQAPRALPSSD
jgi:hypothetical protein